MKSWIALKIWLAEKLLVLGDRAGVNTTPHKQTLEHIKNLYTTLQQHEDL